MLGAKPNIKKGDEFYDVNDKSTITVSKVDVWNNVIEFTRRTDDYKEFRFGFLPIAEFEWFVELGHFKSVDDETNHYHTYKHYVGFTEIYDYCTGCDMKRPHLDYYCNEDK